MSFAEKLKTLRQQNEMTQEYVANRLNVARSTIAGYETKNRQPSHEKLTALAALFKVSVDYLLDEDETIIMDLSDSAPVSDNERELIVHYRNLSSRSRLALMEYLRFLELRDRENL